MNTPDESAEWVIKIIDSCQNGFHLDCARKLVDCFKERYGDGGSYQKIMEKLVAKEPMIIII
jgi:hypothetical protein